MTHLIFCLFLFAASYTIKAADNLVGEYITHKDLEAFEKYQTFETFKKNLKGDWVTLIKPSGKYLSVRVPTLQYQKFPCCTAFALERHEDTTCSVLQISFDYTQAKRDTAGNIGYWISGCDSITHYKKLDYNTADACMKSLTEALEKEDASLECIKD